MKQKTLYLIGGVGLLLLLWKEKKPTPANSTKIATGMEKIIPPYTGLTANPSTS